MKLSPDSLLLSPRNNNRDEECLIHSSPEQDMKKTVSRKRCGALLYLIIFFKYSYFDRLPNRLLEADLVWDQVAAVQLSQSLMQHRCEVVRHLHLTILVQCGKCLSWLHHLLLKHSYIGPLLSKFFKFVKYFLLQILHV